MIELEAHGGEHIATTAARMVAEAVRTGDVVEVDFNGVRLSASEATTARDIEAAYDAETTKRREAYRSSPEGKADAARRLVEVNRKKAKVADLMSVLPQLGWTNLDRIIGWLGKLQAASDDVSVPVPWAKIVETFRANGFEPGVNTGDEFQEFDRDNVARYIVGQALSCLASPPHAIHPVFHSHAAKWRKQFCCQSTAQQTQ